MRLRTILPVVTASLLPACPGSDTAKSATGSLPLALAVIADEPAVLFTPDSGLALVISGITYDDFGRLRSFGLDFVLRQADTLRAQIEDADTSSAPEARRFEARAGSLTLTPVPPDSTSLPVGLVPKDPGALRLRGADSVVTEMAYDSFGRQQVAAQEFTLGSTRWRAVFGDYKRDDAGRFVSFRVRFEPKGS